MFKAFEIWWSDQRKRSKAIARAVKHFEASSGQAISNPKIVVDGPVLCVVRLCYGMIRPSQYKWLAVPYHASSPIQELSYDDVRRLESSGALSPLLL